MAAACPVIGTTNDVLPPNHPEVDLSKDGQVCPVVGAKTEHHHNLHKHPAVADADAPPKSPVATQCPVLQKTVQDEKSRQMDDAVCPVVGTATTVLPPNHPNPAEAKAGDVCPVTKATVGHHADKMHVHPAVSAGSPHGDAVAKGAVCPVTGAKADA